MDMFNRFTRQTSMDRDHSDVEIGGSSSNNTPQTTSSAANGYGQRQRRNIVNSDTEPLIHQPSPSSSSSSSMLNPTTTANATSPLSNNATSSDMTLVTKDSSTNGPTSNNSNSNSNTSGISKIGYAVLILLAVQNCSKNLLMRYVMQDQPKFFTSTAVLCCECTKLTLSVFYICVIEQRSVSSIITYLQYDMKNTLLLAVPATAYNLQMKLEYVALANLNAAMFSVLVQTKLLFTAVMAATFLQKKLKYIQIISLVLLTVGVMLCNLSGSSNSSSSTGADVALDSKTMTGIVATLGIAISSGFASVYTEKVIKANRSTLTTAPTSTLLAASSPNGGGGSAAFDKNEYGLAYTQVQLAFMSICTIGLYAVWQDLSKILEFGLFYQFSYSAMLSVLNSAIGGLIVASVLKYADSVLKGYATAMSVILTGVLSMMLFGTSLSIIYFLGIINVVTAVLLYNGKEFDKLMC